MMRDLTNIHQIVGHAGDQMPGLIVIEEAEGLFLYTLEQFTPHIGFDVNTKLVAPIGHCIMEKGTEQVDAEQPDTRR